MNPVLFFVMVGIATAILIAIYNTMYVRRTIKQFDQTSKPDPRLLISEAIGDVEFRTYLLSGSHIYAAQRYMDLTGLSFSDAQRVVHYLMAHREILEAASLYQKKKDGTGDHGIRELIRAGKSDEARRIYQSFTGLNEAEAHIEIERIQWEETQK